MIYDKSNIFARIIKKEVPCNLVFEDETLMAFHDINPRAKVHVLVIPKLEVVAFEDFVRDFDSNVVANFFKKVEYIAKNVLKLEHFRLQTNNGLASGQEVFHFHIHILSN